MQLVDFAIVCALKDEYDAVLARFGGGTRGRFAGRDCRFVRFQNSRSDEKYRLVVVLIGEMGNLASLDTCSGLIRELSPRHIILSGICGGLLQSLEDFRLGDVVVSDNVIYYEPAKVLDGTLQSRHFPLKSQGEESHRLLPVALTLAEGEWTANVRIGVPRPNDSNARERPKLRQGDVCSGEKVVASDTRSEELRGAHPNAVSIEMEAAGVAYACRDRATDFLVVKAVSDSAGSGKNDEYRAYACAAAASFVHSLLTEAALPKLEPRHLRTVPLGDLFRLNPEVGASVILPGYPNERHKDAGIDNYPYNRQESAFDDVYCALRIITELESTCGHGNVSYDFDKEFQITNKLHPPNLILLGSATNNAFTKEALKDFYFKFDVGDNDHDIVAPDGGLRYSASLATNSRKTQVLETDYALISVKSTGKNAVVVLAGCRAYGQLLLGDFLSDPEKTDELLRLVPEGDFQCVLRVKVTGRQYSFNGIENLVVREEDNKWQRII